jgi:hypothetical protein
MPTVKRPFDPEWSLYYGLRRAVDGNGVVKSASCRFCFEAGKKAKMWFPSTDGFSTCLFRSHMKKKHAKVFEAYENYTVGEKKRYGFM